MAQLVQLLHAARVRGIVSSTQEYVHCSYVCSSVIATSKD